MKRIIPLILALVLIFALTACNKTPASGGAGSGGSTNNGGGSASGGGSSEVDKSKLEPYTVDFYHICWWNTPTDEGIKGVEDAINEYVQKTLGYPYTLKLHFLAIMEYTTQIDLLLAAGDKIDLVSEFSYDSMVVNGYLLPLDQFLDKELADTAELLGDWLESGRTKGVTYGIPCHKGVVLTYCYEYQDSYINGINYDMSKIKDFYDLEDLYAKLHAKYPNIWVDVDCSRYPDMIAQLNKVTVVGTYGCTLGDNSTLVSYYESDAWKQALDYAWKYRNNGYVDPEGSQSQKATTALTPEMLVGYNIAYGRDPAAQGVWLTTSWNVPCSAVTTCVQNLTVGGGAKWGIAYTSKNPSASATLLNLMWTDYFVLNTLMYGIEGRDYVVTEATKDYTPAGIGAYEYPEGFDGDSVPYQCQLNDGIFGDEFLMLRSSGTTSYTRQYMQEQIDKAWKCPTFGFTPDTADVQNQLTALSNINSQYRSALCYGDINPSENATFVKLLKEAGVDDVIANYNQQIQEWLAAK